MHALFFVLIIYFALPLADFDEVDIFATFMDWKLDVKSTGLKGFYPAREQFYAWSVSAEHKAVPTSPR
ncbi:MAG: hypothetical protein EOO60_00770 [Hymenobacter sp.]|nr:MAG: hypothetical protein EOO60_00770 [Hymenobacter sp.]